MHKLLPVVGCAALLAPALAYETSLTASMPVVTLVAETPDAAAELTLPWDAATVRDDRYVWRLTDEHALTAGSSVLGRIGPGELTWEPGRSFSLGFSAQAGGESTSFSVTTSLVGWNGADAYVRANGAFTLLDFLDDGAVLNGSGPQGGAVWVHYNIPPGLTFVEAVEQMVVLPGEDMEVTSFEHPAGGGYEFVPALENIQVGVQFALTPYDMVSGSADVEMSTVPEPTSLAPLALLSLLLGRRAGGR